MSFAPSYINVAQDSKSENPTIIPLARTKDSHSGLNHSQPNVYRAFGREISNIPTHHDPKMSSNEYKYESYKIQMAMKPSEVIMNQEKQIQRTHSMRVQSTKPLKENNPPRASLRDFTVALSSQQSLASNTVSENMEMESAEFSENITYTEEVSMENCDIRAIDNPQYVSEYASTIFKFLREDEKYLATFGYLGNQQDINQKMRAILIDWLVDVHHRFKLLEETLYMTVNIIDRYLEKREISRQKLQLVGVTAMLIASKYEEIYAPEVKDFVYVTDNAYTREEILDCEGKILEALEFKLTMTSSFRFLERYSRVHEASERSRLLARYLTELALIEYSMLRYTPSNIAASALYLACKIMKKTAWSDIMEKNTQYTEMDVRPCAKDLCILLQNANKTSLQAIRRKFALPKFMEISKIQLDRY